MMLASKILGSKTNILGVSILTSLDSKQTKKFYNEKDVSKLVTKYSKAAKKNLLDGIVCSPKEIRYVRKAVGKNFIIVTPGIRIDNKINSDDQKRVSTPKNAINMGANYIVIGRPITKAKNPLKMLQNINKTLLNK